ncbi:MAG: hypothetical protein IJ857_07575 [Lachnospiraceae bacterium]|nr:hypothetical protein [Lachnospiraceae bacterium]
MGDPCRKTRSEAPPVNLNFFSYKGSSAEIQVYTDGKASSRLFVKGTVSGEPEHYISISDNSSGDEGIKVNTEYGHIICKVSDTGDNLTEYKLDYICPIQDSISKNEPTGRITTYHHLPNDVCITYNAMVSAYVLYGTDKKNFRKELGDIEISRNGIRYVATDGKIVKLKHHDGGVWYEYFLQIKGMERAGFDPSGAVTLSGNSGLSKAEIMSDKKLLKAIKKATKKHHDNYENPLELGIYAYRLTGNMGDGDYQYTVEDYDILDTSVTVKFNVNGKTVKAVHGKKDQGDKQLVAYYSNDRYFKVESNSLSGSISMDKIPGVLN